jgi:hypothetical protein
MAGEKTVSEWKAAAAETRSTAKWLVVTLAAVAAAVFGAGPILTVPKIMWEQHTDRAIAAAGLAILAMCFIVWLINHVAMVLVPIKVSLDRLPAEVLRDNKDRLPGDCRNVAELQDELARWTRVVQELPAQVATLKAKRGDASLAQRATLDAEIAAVEKLLKAARQRRRVYQATSIALLDEAGFVEVRNAFRPGAVGAMAIAAGAFTVAFQFTLASATQPDDKAGNAAAGKLGVLMGRQEASRELWTQLGLARCENSADPGKVPVLVTSGEGTPEKPYAVTVVPLSPTCQAQSFTVINAVAQVSFPEPTKIEIDYRPAAPSTTTSSPVNGQP